MKRASHQNIENALRAERPMRTVSPGFSERVIDALPSRPLFGTHRAEELPARRRGTRLAWAAALGAITFVTWFVFAPKPSAPEVARVPAQPDAALTASIEPALPRVTLHQVQALTAQIDQPLERELERVLADTRNAIRFVASNFLPEN